MNKAIFRAMKPGGIYVIVDNSADAGAVTQDVTAAGFATDGASEKRERGTTGFGLAAAPARCDDSNYRCE